MDAVLLGLGRQQQSHLRQVLLLLTTQWVLLLLTPLEGLLLRLISQ